MLHSRQRTDRLAFSSLRRGGGVLLLSLGLVLGGCSSSGSREPESDYAVVRPLIYDYGLVFDCVAETIQEQGFQVATCDREAGILQSEDVPGRADVVAGTQEGHRIRAQVVKRGPKDFFVRLAATRLERDASATGHGEWRYMGSDPVLLEKLKKQFDKQVEKRYKPQGDKG